jgi:hypothetical protein
LTYAFIYAFVAGIPFNSLSGPREKREAKREKKIKKEKREKKAYLGQPIRRIHVGHGTLQVSCRDYHLPPWTDRAAPDPFMATSLLAEGGSS